MHRRIAGRLTGRVTKWIVLAFWIAVLPVAGYFGSQLVDEQDNELTAWLPASAESTLGFERLSEVTDTDTLPTVIVYQRDGGLTPDDLAAAAADAEELASLPHLAPATDVRPSVLGPIPSDPASGELIAQTVVALEFGGDSFDDLPGIVDRLHAIADRDGVNVYVTGAGGSAADQSAAFEGLDTSLLFAALGVVVLLLLLAYRSPVLWLLPVISALVALFVAQAVVYLLVQAAGITVNGQTFGVLSVLVIGVSVDYALLLVARYREELRRHEDRHEAMAVALHRASPAIIASGLTVGLAMLCLLLAEMSSTAGMGPVAAVGVAVGVLVMLTLLPALLVICGRWVFWPLRPAHGTREPTADGFWARVGNAIGKAPRLVWITTAGVLALACLALLRVDTSGLSTEESYTRTMESVVGQQVLTDHGIVDDTNPVQVVVDARQAGQVVATLAMLDGLEAPGSPQVFGDTALVEAALTDDPTSQAAFDTVRDVRTAVHDIPGADALVTGTSAVTLDINDASRHDDMLIMPLVLLIVLLVLIGLLRALVAPLLLMATVVLSFGAAFGLSWLIFEFVLGHAAMNAGTPLLVFVFLVALGIDYNIFLVTRVREETAEHGTRAASRIALAATGGVITSAGLVLAGTFAVLTTMPLVDFVQAGVAIALGIVIDTFIVRSVLVTALNLDLGGRIWWPSRLDRADTVN